MKTLCCLLMTLLCLPALSQGQTKPLAGEVSLSIDISQSTIYTALNEVCKKAKRTCRIEEDLAAFLRRKRCSLKLEHVPLEVALDALSSVSRPRFRFKVTPQTVIIEFPLITLEGDNLTTEAALKGVFGQVDADYICTTHQEAPKSFLFAIKSKPLKVALREILSHDSTFSLSRYKEIYVLRQRHRNILADAQTTLNFNSTEVSFDTIMEACFRSFDVNYVMPFYSNKPLTLFSEGRDFRGAFRLLLENSGAPITYTISNNVWTVMYPHEGIADSP
jgi:hypothetical protein